MILNAIRGKRRLRTGAARRDALMSICILAVCSCIGFAFHALKLSEANIISIYILGILLIASITSSWTYGALSSVAGVLFFNFLYADPTFNFYVYDWQYSITMVVMLCASLIANYVMILFRGQIDREILETRRLDILLETNKHLQQAKNVDEIFDVTLTQLHRMFEGTILLFPVADSALPPQPMSRGAEDGAFCAGEWTLDARTWKQCLDNEAKTPCIHIGRAGNKLVLFTLRSEKTVFAVTGIVVAAAKKIVGCEHNLVAAMLDEVALSLEKHQLHQFNERIAREAEAERLRTNLLRSISHDLRTPLTSISGNADILLSDGDRIKPHLRRQLYQDIYNDSEWLIKLVENLLFITRIDNGVMPIRTESEVLQEIISESLTCLTKRARERNIVYEPPDALLVVKADARLLMQVLINLVDNAVRFTPAGSTIRIQAYPRASRAVVEVADAGCGISDEDKQKVFDMFYTTNKQSGDSRRGIGLGLPLCRAIIAAHGGAIRIADNAPCGVVASFTLPLEEVLLENAYPGY